MSNYEKLHDALCNVLSNHKPRPENPTAEDRATMQKLYQTIERYRNLILTDYSMTWYSRDDELMDFNNAVVKLALIGMMTKDDTQKSIDAFKDLIDYHKDSPHEPYLIIPNNNQIMGD